MSIISILINIKWIISPTIIDLTCKILNIFIIFNFFCILWTCILLINTFYFFIWYDYRIFIIIFITTIYTLFITINIFPYKWITIIKRNTIINVIAWCNKLIIWTILYTNIIILLLKPLLFMWWTIILINTLL